MGGRVSTRRRTGTGHFRALSARSAGAGSCPLRGKGGRGGLGPGAYRRGPEGTSPEPQMTRPSSGEETAPRTLLRDIRAAQSQAWETLGMRAPSGVRAQEERGWEPSRHQGDTRQGVAPKPPEMWQLCPRCPRRGSGESPENLHTDADGSFNCTVRTWR